MQTEKCQLLLGILHFSVLILEFAIRRWASGIPYCVWCTVLRIFISPAEGRERLPIRILDESGLLACAAYVDLNPIRAALAETLEASEYTSVQRRFTRGHELANY
ncbi:MAG: hypothetical protein KDB01_27435 [Planctomycetaceae bacterium]|nr:hypothetical protein [Planctomycetaceae bacterium]